MIISAKYLKIQTDYIVAVFVVGKKSYKSALPNKEVWRKWRNLQLVTNL